MKVLVTGSKGFLGEWLCRHLRMLSIHVYSFDINLTDYAEVKNFLQKNPVDVVVHFAGVSSVGQCNSDIPHAIRVNTEASLLLAKVVSDLYPDAHFIFASTSQVYAFQEGYNYLDEKSLVRPSSIYALSKYMAETALEYFSYQNNFSVTVLRLFNHSHRSQSDSFFLPSVHGQILQAKLRGGNIANISVGNIELDRDFGAVQDLVEIIVKIVRVPPVYSRRYNLFNVASGVAKNLRAIIEEIARREGVDLRITVEQARFRQGEPKTIVGNISKISAEYSWMPQKSQSVASLVDAFLANE